MKKLPMLYHKTRTGAIQQWQVWSDKDSVHTEYGQKDGKLQQTSKKVVQKNIGKSNETDLKTQAELEAKSLWQNKLDRKYSENIQEAQEELFLPMLAHDFMKRGKNISYPVDIQPKLDGCRCLAYWQNDQVYLMSRSGKPWIVKHISKALETILPKNTILDGELYQHGVGFQTITKLIKKARPESVNITYQVYDSPINNGIEDNNWAKRKEYLEKLLSPIKNSPIILVPSHTVESFQEILKRQAEYLENGYEGTIIRLMNGLYEFGYRSPSLLKYKEFDDDEFKVVGFYEGVGKYSGCVTWQCVTEDGKQFNAVPKGTLEEKADWFENGKKYIGKWLKVKYQGVSDDGIPRFPIGIGFRDMERDK